MSEKSGRNTGPLVWGIVLICIGIFFLLQNWLGVRIVWRFVLDWWPLAFVILGTFNLYRYFTARG